MQKGKEQLILTKDDHEIIMGYIRIGLNRSTFSLKEAEGLEAELKKARLVERSQLPEDVVCLNSTVTIKEEKTDKLLELTLVRPEQADIKLYKISILSPIAAALIGFRKGMKVAWKVPAGLKTFSIIDVRKQLQASAST